MFSCRELYHDLPQAMSKWCLVDSVFSEPITFFDEDSTRLLGLGQPASRGLQPADAHATTAHDVTSDPAAAPSLAVWLEHRFLAYSWLGATWHSDCRFLIRLATTPPLLGHGFSDVFATCGRVRFRDLDAVSLWANAPDRGGQRADTSSTAVLAEATAMGDSVSASSTTPQVVREDQQHQQQQEQQSVQQDQQQEDLQQQDQDDRKDHHHQQQQQQQQQTVLCPALFFLDAQLQNQEAADIWHELRLTALAGTLQYNVTLRVDEQLAFLAASDIDTLRIDAANAPIDTVAFSNVRRLEFALHNTMEAIHGTFEQVHCVALQSWPPIGLGFPWARIPQVGEDQRSPLCDASALAGIPHVDLSRCRNQMDLSPLHGVRKLLLSECLSTNIQAVVAAADDLVFRSAVLTGNTLAATRVELGTARAVPLDLDLPNATHISLVGPRGVIQLTCPPYLRLLRDTRNMSMHELRLPAFEHAVHVELSVVDLVRQQLADLGRRVDRLVLRCSGHCRIEDLRDIPDSVHVGLEAHQAVNIGAPVPPCVQELQLLCNETFQPRFVTSVPHLRLQAEAGAYVRVHDIHYLSGRQHLHLERCKLDGIIAECEQLVLADCSGAVTISSTACLTVVNAARTTSRPHSPDHPLLLRSITDVSTCRLEGCHIGSFSCFDSIQRLILNNCEFDDVSSLPHVTSLVLRGCRSTGNAGNWQWPNVVMVHQSPTEMAATLQTRRTADRSE
ncbi:hypothetical protein PTSG_09227 [Salpingoeca rosetta]|uniref:Uncharacterized protein n=1 Tax=Salpingoeca rosetta (strain ATCC 50818 / BSB-021) TaxID=946362 RepID=F2UN33_SALR5|nr:uncharacterized protein PTSG_09227 [Salpingoeca rosetta]EGD78532.1 hypothetical protein PTSG_09227 [Salpingoeca rosetta]|eukprot:XP_004989481.1 hypothetical protein PTSG_09227 [Salpingoeca rosetta]